MPMPDFEVRQDVDSAGVRAKVSGEIDLDTSPQLWEQLRGILKKRPPKLTVDLADVGYIDSSGVAVLIQTLKHADRDRVELVLSHPSAKVEDVLALAQLTILFNIDRS